MSDKNDAQIAKAVERRKALNAAETQRLTEVAAQKKAEQAAYDAAAEKFRSDRNAIDVSIERKNRVLEDLGISLSHDGGIFRKGSYLINLAVSDANSKSQYPRLIFTLTSDGLRYNTQNHSRSNPNNDTRISVNDATYDYYDDAITEFVKFLLED